MTNTLIAVANSFPSNQSIKTFAKNIVETTKPIPQITLPTDKNPNPWERPAIVPPRLNVIKPNPIRALSEKKFPANPAGIAKKRPGSINRPISVPISA